jgi:transglutaminase-like putative cysteine protease
VSGPDPFARSTVLDAGHEAVRAVARGLAGGGATGAEIARRTFEWVRDRVPHTDDCGAEAVACSASEVLARGTGFCYAKSHLLVALLRAAGLRAGLCYQRLASDGGFVLHGLVAVELPGVGWYRMDARGGTKGARAVFAPPVEALAYVPEGPGEWDSRAVLADPLPEVVSALRRARSADELRRALPDRESPPAP